MINKSASIFKEGVYNPSRSLIHEIEILSTPETNIDIYDIINLVAKYFFAYIYTESINLKVKEEEINDIFNRFSFYCENAHYAKKFSFSKESNIFRTSSYQLCMLWDISSTVDIIKDIITRKIDDIFWNKAYYWIDLWTGSGILLLAQYVQARRNWLIPQDNTNIGIELDKNVRLLSQTLAQKVWFWKIIQWDIREQKTFNELQISSHFVSNENLPNETNTFGMSDDIKEPFFESIFALEDCITLEWSKFFPEQQIDLESSISRRDIRTFYESFLWKKPRIHPSSRLYPIAIEINWRIQTLSEVGKTFEESGIIKQAVTNERRWF